MYRSIDVVFLWFGDHRNLHVLTRSFPTLRSADLHTPLTVLLVENNGPLFFTRNGVYTVFPRKQSFTLDLNVLIRFKYRGLIRTSAPNFSIGRSEEHTS